jgi:hypothetical protein
VDMLHSREFDASGLFFALARIPPRAKRRRRAPSRRVPHARLPVNSSLDETMRKFSSLQSIEKSQNVEIIAPFRTSFASRESAS